MDETRQDDLLDNALDFIAGIHGQKDGKVPIDDNYFAWMLMNGDLGASLPPQVPPMSPAGTFFPEDEVRADEARAATPLSMGVAAADSRSIGSISPSSFLMLHRSSELSSELGYPAANGTNDGLLSAALSRAAGLRSGAQAAIMSGWNKIAATIGLQSNRDDEDGAGDEGSGQDLAAMLQSTGDAFSFAQPATTKRKRPTSFTTELDSSNGAMGRGKRRRGQEGLRKVDAVAVPVVQQPEADRTTRLGGRPSDIQRKMQELNAENASLKAQLHALTSAQSPDASAYEEQRRRQLQTIMEMLQTGTPEPELRRAILQYKDAHSDYGKHRRAALKYHLRCLKRLLLPSSVTRVCMWSVGEADSAAHGKQEESPAVTALWNELARACELTPDQIARISTLNESVKKRRSEFSEVLGVFRALEDKALENLEGLEFQMNLLMSHLSVRQVGLFLQWLEANNSAFARVAPVAVWPQSGHSNPEDASVSAEPVTANANGLKDPIEAAAAERVRISRSRKRRDSSLDAPAHYMHHLPVDAAMLADDSNSRSMQPQSSGGLFGSGFTLRSIPIPSLLSSGLNSVSNALPSLPQFLSRDMPNGGQGSA